MPVASETVVRRYINIAAGVPISVDIQLYEQTEVKVIYGIASLEAQLNVDYTVALGGDFNTFTLTPLAPLLMKINALIAAGGGEVNAITVRRETGMLTSTTADAVRYTPFTAREIERGLMRVQEIRERLWRSIALGPRFTGTEEDALQIDSIVPNRALMFDSEGKKLIPGPDIVAERLAAAASALAAAASVVQAAGFSSQAASFANDAWNAARSATEIVTGLVLADTPTAIEGTDEAKIMAVFQTHEAIRAQRLSPQVKDYGAVGDNVTDDSAAFAALMAASPTSEIAKGTYRLGAPIDLVSDRTIRGAGGFFNAVTLVADGDFPIFRRDPDILEASRLSVSNVLVRGSNLETAYAIDLDTYYITQFNELFLDNFGNVNVPNGIRLQRVDSANFMGTRIFFWAGVALFIGRAARNLNFIGGNCEAAPGTIGARVVIDNRPGVEEGEYVYKIRALFKGWQFERSRIDVLAGSHVVFQDCDITTTKLFFGADTAHCVIEGSDVAGQVIDIGFDNKMERLKAHNISPGVSGRPARGPLTPVNGFFGGDADEVLFFTSVYPVTKTAQTVDVEYQNASAAEIVSSPVFHLPSSNPAIVDANALNYGEDSRPVYTDVSCVRAPAGGVKPVAAAATGTVRADVWAARSLLANGTFPAGDTTGWTIRNATATYEDGNVVLTETAAGAAMHLLVPFLAGEDYLIIARVKAADMAIGEVWNGAQGGRKLLCETSGNEVFEDGTEILQLWFRAVGQDRVSIGKLLTQDGTPSEVKWVAVVRLSSAVRELTGEAVYDPPSLAAGASAATANISVTGAEVGDFVTGISFTQDLNGTRFEAYVSATNTVTFRHTNPSTSTRDLASGVVRVKVQKR